MQAFAQDSRIQRTEKGVYFYEQDVLYSPYLFAGNITVDIQAEFARPGLGIVLAEDNEKPFRDATHRYLFDVGAYEYNVYEKHNMTQAQGLNVSSTIRPGKGKQMHFRFVMERYQMKAYLVIKSKEEKDKELEELLGTYKFSRKFHHYRIGIYSEKGNTINNVAFLQDIPEHWNVSSENVRGGRIAFIEDGFFFENCLKDAEVEQNCIELKSGKYYLRYETEPVNGEMDIQCFVYSSNPAISSKTNAPTDDSMEDEKKSILDPKTRSFILLQDGMINIKFKGTSGKITRISLMDSDNSDFVKTYDAPAKSTGSSIVVNTTGVKRITWEGIIFDLPEWKDMKEKCPYAIVATSIERLNKNTFPVPLDTPLLYEYDTGNRMVYARTKSDTLVASYKIRSNPNYPTFTIFENIKAVVSNLIVHYENGAEVNINIQKTYKTFVPATIVGPIIVTNAEGESYDLSASYREIVEPVKRIDILKANASEYLLDYHCADVIAKPEVFGVPAGVKINKWVDTIKEMCPQCQRINDVNVTLKNHKITIPEAVRRHFDYMLVSYQSSENFVYRFTNYEREIFDGEVYLVLDKIPSAAQEAIYIYGIPETSNIYDDYFYRVPNEGMMHSIDLCVDSYDILKSDQYTVNTGTGEINIDKSLKNKYKNFIVDYLKCDSYCINFNDQLSQYEVDIASENPVMRVHYEMEKSTMESSGIIRTQIKPDKNKFVVLRRKEDAFLEN